MRIARHFVCFDPYGAFAPERRERLWVLWMFLGGNRAWDLTEFVILPDYRHTSS